MAKSFFLIYLNWCWLYIQIYNERREGQGIDSGARDDQDQMR